MTKKSIFITGSAKGIGKSTALFFAQKGWFVGLLDIDLNGLNLLAAEIGKDNCSVHIADVRNPEQLQFAFNEFGKLTNGKLTVLFNNAGVLFPNGFEKVQLETHKLVVDVNFIGVLNSTYCALPMLKETENSAIVNMCSAGSLFGNPEIVAYAATKSAVKSLTEGWNMLFKKYGIHVADLLPS